MKTYVLGFVFEVASENVLLIEKNRPVEQAGKLNGIGGKIEQGETPEQAIVRETEEETGLVIPQKEWKPVIQFGGEHFNIYIFTTCIRDLSVAYSKTDERIVINKYTELAENKCVENTRKFLYFSLNALYDQFDKKDSPTSSKNKV